MIIIALPGLPINGDRASRFDIAKGTRQVCEESINHYDDTIIVKLVNPSNAVGSGLSTPQPWGHRSMKWLCAVRSLGCSLRKKNTNARCAPTLSRVGESELLRVRGYLQD